MRHAYWVWTAREELNRATNALTKIVGPHYSYDRIQYRDNVEAEKLQKTFDAIRYVDSLARTVSEMIRLQKGGKMSFWTQKEAIGSAHSVNSYSSALSLYAECKLYRLMTTKPTPVPTIK